MCKAKFKLPGSTMRGDTAYKQGDIIDISCDEAKKFGNIFEVSKDGDCAGCGETKEPVKMIKGYKNKKLGNKENKDCSAC